MWGWGPVLTGACGELRKGGKAEERNKSEGEWLAMAGCWPFHLWEGGTSLEILKTGGDALSVLLATRANKLEKLLSDNTRKAGAPFFSSDFGSD